MSAKRESIQFVTGRLAESALRETVSRVAEHAGFEFEIDVLPITVAALMTPDWIARKINRAIAADRVLVPGYVRGELAPIAEATNKVVERGPRDLYDLPQYFGGGKDLAGYGEYSIEIIAEINHAPALATKELISVAARLRNDGADVIDVGCSPGEPWSNIGEAVAMLKSEGHRVSVDSLNPREIAPAVKAGAELVLSVNASNRRAAVDWGCEVVVIPDDIPTLGGMVDTIELLESQGVPYRLDPILEPIGVGFAASLARYSSVRKQFPHAAMMMGIGNLTELTDVDSAGVNVLLLGFCQELAIHSVLTTQVINWSRTSVRECDLARRLVHFAVERGVIPKHLEPRLVTLRDEKVTQQGVESIARLAKQIRDNNFRIFAEAEEIHVVSADLHLQNADPFLLFDELMQRAPQPIDPSHAFYLGYEMAKAATAITLAKQYRQDESLDWGYLTREEVSHRLRKRASDM